MGGLCTPAVKVTAISRPYEYTIWMAFLATTKGGIIWMFESNLLGK